MRTYQELEASSRPFQRTAAQVGIRKERSLLWSPPGSGKTLMGLMIRQGLGLTDESTLVVGSRPALSAWMHQIPQWLDIDPEQILYVRGNWAADRRAKVWKMAKEYPFTLALYDTVKADMKRGTVPLQWPALIADEFHKCRNRARGNWLAYKRLKAEAEVMMTGTPMRHNAMDAFTMFNRLDPKIWTSFWRYANTFCYIENNGFGNEVYGTRNPKRFAELVEKYGTWYTKADLKDQMPEMGKYYMEVEMDPKTSKIYRQLEEDFFAEIPSGGILATPNKMTSLLRLRQLLVCPKILDEDLPYGSGIEAIVELAASQPHFAVYTPFRHGIPHIRAALEASGYPSDAIFEIAGGMDPQVLTATVHKFLGAKGILLGTIQSAEAYSLSTCDTAVFLGYDWSWDVNEQAEDRIRRLDSSSDFVTVYYIRHADTVDDDVMDNIIMNRKAVRTYAKHRRRRAK